MFGLIKTFFTFGFFYILISLPVSNKPLFFHMNVHTQPIVERIYKNTIEALVDLKKKILKPTGEKLKNNIYSKIDEVSTKMSANKKIDRKMKNIKKEYQKKFHHHNHDHNHNYSDEDRKKLFDLL